MPTQVQPTWEPRIVPSPPEPSRRGLVVALLIGLVVGLIVAGPSGYLIGAGTGDPNPQPSASSTADPNALPPFEASQLALNKPKFENELAAFAEAWMPVLGVCVSSADPDGPKLQGTGERLRIFCRHGIVAVNFVLFKSLSDRDDARIFWQRLSLKVNELAPGAAEPSRKTGKKHQKFGSYIEYGLQDDRGRTVTGVWWDWEESPVAVYYETFWERELGRSWEPLRDLWQRYS